MQVARSTHARLSWYSSHKRVESCALPVSWRGSRCSLKSGSTVTRSSKTTSPVCDLFVSELLVSQDAVNRSLSLYPELLRIDVVSRGRPVAQYLQHEVQLTADDIGRILLRHPQVFGYSLEDRIEPVVSFLRHDVKLQPADLRTLVTRFPIIFSYNVKAHLLPQLAYLLSLGISEQQLPGLVLDRPMVLGEGIDTVISYIKAQGVPRKHISRLIRSYPIDYQLHLHSPLAAPKG